MKKTMLLSWCFAAIAGAAQTTPYHAVNRTPAVCLADSEYLGSWDPAAGSYVYSSKEYYTYNAAGEKVTSMSRMYSGNAWNNLSFTTFSYGADDLLASAVTQSWNAGWVNSSQVSYTYNAAGKQLVQLNERWNIPASQWESQVKTTSGYDASNNLISQTSQTWTGSSWTNYSSRTYTVDASGNELVVLSQYWSGTSWVNQNRTTNTFDAANNVLTGMFEYWNTGTNAWIKQTNVIYTYDAAENLLSRLVQSWSATPGVWENSNRSTYTYDVNNNQLTSHYEYWNATANAWVNQSQTTYTYDAANLLTGYVGQAWQNNAWVNTQKQTNSYNAQGFLKTVAGAQWTSNAWQNSYYYDYFYTCSTAGVRSFGSGAFAKLWPVPATDEINVACDQRYSSIRITDMLGRNVLLAEPSSVVSLGSLKSGVYIVQLLDNNGGAVHSARIEKL